MSSKPVPRSRLNLTYRTKIDGVVSQKRLPFRMLVLGDFSGPNGRKEKFEDRRVMSLGAGTKISSYMADLELSCPIEDKKLASKVPAKLTATITGKVKKRLDEDGRVLVVFSGTGTIEGAKGDNGLGDFRGQVAITGKAEATKDKRHITLDPAKLRIVGTAKGEVTGKVDFKTEHVFGGEPIDEDELSLDLSQSVPLEVTIPIRSINDFTPQHVANAVPEIRRRVVLRRLLTEIRNHLSGEVALRTKMKSLLSSGQDLAELKTWLEGNYPQLRLTSATEASSNDAAESDEATAA